MEDIMRFSTGDKDVGETASKGIEDSLTSYAQFSQIADDVKNLGTGPLM